MIICNIKRFGTFFLSFYFYFFNEFPSHVMFLNRLSHPYFFVANVNTLSLKKKKSLYYNKRITLIPFEKNCDQHDMIIFLETKLKFCKFFKNQHIV